MCCTLRNIKYFIILQLSWLSDWQVDSAEKFSSFTTFHRDLRRQYGDGETFKADVGPVTDSAKAEAARFTGTKPPKKKKQKVRTTPQFISQPHYCDHMAKPCLHAYVTGKLCARTIYYWYQTFDTYCLMEYVNCREGYEVWQMVHTGACFTVPVVGEYIHYVYHDDAFLDNYYILEDKMI